MKYHNGQPLRHVGDIPTMSAERYGEKTALAYHDDELTYVDLEERANRIANALVSEGVEPDDRVSIHMENNLEYMPLVFGIIKTGAVPVPLNFRMDHERLAYIVEDAGVDVLVGSAYFAEPLADLHEAAGLSLSLVPGGDEGLSDYDEWLTERPTTFDRPERAFEDVALQCYTSGTTGAPKGVLTTHENILTTLNSYARTGGMDPERETVLTIVPLFHAFGLGGITIQGVYDGATVVIRTLPEPADLLEAITDHGVTSFSAVPAIFLDMIGELEANPETYDISSIESLGVGAAPLADDTRRRIENAFGTPLVEGWGMTETTPAGTVSSSRGIQKSAGCIGQPLDGLELKLVDPTTRETRVPFTHIDPNAPADLTGFEPDFEDEATYTGEIAIRGPQIFNGYHNLPEKNEQVFDDDGWFYTKDIARIDEERSLWMVDRLDDMMVVGGENVYPAEVENALFDHPAVAEAAVVAAPHETKGEAPVAYVVLEEDADITEDELREFSLDHVSTYAHPRRIFFVEELPRSGTQKVQRYKLEERATTDIEHPLTSRETV